MRDRDTTQYIAGAPVKNYAIDLVLNSKYIRLITPNGTRRVSRRVALQAIIDTTKCRDCRDTDTWCEACRYIENPLRIDARRIYLDGTACGAILDC